VVVFVLFWHFRLACDRPPLVNSSLTVHWDLFCVYISVYCSGRTLNLTLSYSAALNWRRIQLTSLKYNFLSTKGTMKNHPPWSTFNMHLQMINRHWTMTRSRCCEPLFLEHPGAKTCCLMLFGWDSWYMLIAVDTFKPLIAPWQSWHHQVQMAEQWMQQSEYGLTDTQRDSLGAPGLVCWKSLGPSGWTWMNYDKVQVTIRRL